MYVTYTTLVLWVKTEGEMLLPKQRKWVEKQHWAPPGKGLGLNSSLKASAVPGGASSLL